ncbi:Peroxidasin [Aphelenchoides fujianensis]|nr:Peroxidasin [Aphelenchoides fujianensis]
MSDIYKCSTIMTWCRRSSRPSALLMFTLQTVARVFLIVAFCVLSTSLLIDFEDPHLLKSREFGKWGGTFKSAMTMAELFVVLLALIGNLTGHSSLYLAFFVIHVQFLCVLSVTSGALLTFYLKLAQPDPTAPPARRERRLFCCHLYPVLAAQKLKSQFNITDWSALKVDDGSCWRGVCPKSPTLECVAGKYRSSSAVCNNVQHPHWGAAHAPFQWLTPACLRGRSERMNGEGRGYDLNKNPSTLDEYAAAAGFFFVALRPDTLAQSTDRQHLSALFGNPALLYEPNGMQTAVRSAEITGLSPYTTVREHCGLPCPRSFDDLRPLLRNPEDVEKLEEVYATVDDGDLFVLGLAERPERGALVGPTFTCILREQFSRVKHGDRFWYSNGDLGPSGFSDEQLAEIRKTTFASIVCANVKEASTLRAPGRVSGHPLPSARTISIHVHDDNQHEDAHFSHMLMQFGQLLDHDFTHSPLSRGARATRSSTVPPAEMQFNRHASKAVRNHLFQILGGPNAPIHCADMPTVDLSHWSDHPFCTVRNTTVPLGQTKSVSPCVTCTCTAEGVSRANATQCPLWIAGTSLRDHPLEAIKQDTVCMIQCSAHLRRAKA